MISVPIEGTGSSISIDVLGYENAAANNDSDANWLRSKVRVATGPFSGEIDAAFTTQDFAYFERANGSASDSTRRSDISNLRGLAAVRGQDVLAWDRHHHRHREGRRGTTRQPHILIRN